MNRFITASIILLAFYIVLLGQTKPVAVYDAETKEPIADCYVYTEGQAIIVQTDASGAFDFGRFDSAKRIFFFHAGYARRAMTLKELDQATYSIYLSPANYTTDEVVIEGYRFGNDRAQIAQEVTEVTDKQIAFDNPRTTADALEQTGQVYVQRSQLGGGSPMLRGFTANSVLMVMDGVRMNNAIYRMGNLQNSITVDGNALRSADVLFGPGSVQYGSDALGGVIVFNTRDPLPSLSHDALTHLSGFTRYSTAAGEKTAGATAEFGLRKWAFLGSFTYGSFGDLRTGSVRSDAYPNYGRRTEYVVREGDSDVVVKNDNSAIQRPSGYTQANTLGKIRYWHNARFNATYALLYTTSSKIPRYDRLTEYRNGALRYGDWYYGPQKWLMNRLSLNLSGAGVWYNNAQVTLSQQTMEESRNDRNFGNDNLRSRTETVNVYALNADLSRPLGNGELYYGIDAAYNTADSKARTRNLVTGEIGTASTRYPDGGSNTTSLAAYGGWKVPAAKHVIVTAGVRYTQNMLSSKFDDKSFYDFPYDKIEINSGAPTASLGAVCSLGAWQARSALSSGFRSPNVDDAGKVFNSSPGMVIVPNPDLGSEYSYNAELGLERTFADCITLGSTGYYSRLTDAIVVGDYRFNGQDSIVYDGTMSKVKALVNTGRAYLSGVDVFAKAKFATQWTASTKLSTGNGRDLEANLPMRPVPPLFGQTSVLYEAPRWTGELFAVYNAWKQEEDIPLSGGEVAVYTTDGVPSWWTLNLRGSVRPIEHLELTAALENIFDLHYRPYGSGISAPGRNFVIALRSAF